MPKILLFILALTITFQLQAQDSTWFSHVTEQVGLDSATALRINTVDINNDDYPDLVLIENYNQRGLIRVYLNVDDTASTDPKDRMFIDYSDSSGVNIHPDYPDSSHRVDVLALADVNNDGNVDLVHGTWHWSIASINFPQDRAGVMLGDGTGKFSPVANNGFVGLGLISITGFSFFDYNQDGNLDVYVATFSDDHPNTQFRKDHLMRGNGDGTFNDVTSPFDIGTVIEPMYGISAADWNNDGWTDIFTSPYCRSGGSLWRNNNGSNFSDVSFLGGYSAQHMQGDNGQDLCQWGAYPYDFDNDGDMDIVQMLVHGGLDSTEGRSTIAVNTGPGNGYRLQQELDRLRRANPNSTHLGNMDATWFDMNNDMLVDMMHTEAEYQAPTDRAFFYLQDTTNYFDDITQDLGLMWMLSPHSVESLDYDLDGDYDLIVNLRLQGNKIAFIENEIGDDNNWVGVKLDAPIGVNFNSIGARIYVHSGGVSQMREIHAGVGHFSGQQPFILNFGLAQNSLIDSIVVHWPSQNFDPTVVLNPGINQIHTISVPPVGLVNNGLNLPEIVLFPNPARNLISLYSREVNSFDLEIMLYDMLGRRQYLSDPFFQSDHRLSFSIENLTSGFYLLEVKNIRENWSQSFRLIKE